MTETGAGDSGGGHGDSRVDTALAVLDDLDSLDLPAQLDAFTDLQAALALILDSPESAESAEGASAHGADSTMASSVS